MYVGMMGLSSRHAPSAHDGRAKGILSYIGAFRDSSRQAPSAHTDSRTKGRPTT
jgi:hypothetical protein